jgi:hypothetical protein
MLRSFSCFALFLQLSRDFAAKITTTEQPVEAMQKKYAQSWYRCDVAKDYEYRKYT